MAPDKSDQGSNSTAAAAPALADPERELLEWLSKEDYSQYGECHGKALDALIANGLAQVHAPGEHQVFIAKGTGEMYRAVSLTAAGIARVRELRAHR